MDICLAHTELQLLVLCAGRVLESVARWLGVPSLQLTAHTSTAPCPDYLPLMHTLVLLRHGESTWNKENRFTGWTDVGLSDQGVAEAHEAARLLAKGGSVFDVAEVMRDLYRLKAEKSLSFGERRMLETARTLIVKEIAVARRKTEAKVQAEIEKIFEN